MVFYNGTEDFPEQKVFKLSDSFIEGILIGEKRGISIGQLTKLINLVCKKLQKGKSNEQIADELEENLENINRICEADIRPRL